MAHEIGLSLNDSDVEGDLSPNQSALSLTPSPSSPAPMISSPPLSPLPSLSPQDVWVAFVIEPYRPTAQSLLHYLKLLNFDSELSAAFDAPAELPKYLQASTGGRQSRRRTTLARRRRVVVFVNAQYKHTVDAVCAEEGCAERVHAWVWITANTPSQAQHAAAITTVISEAQATLSPSFMEVLSKPIFFSDLARCLIKLFRPQGFLNLWSTYFPASPHYSGASREYLYIINCRKIILDRTSNMTMSIGGAELFPSVSSPRLLPLIVTDDRLREGGGISLNSTLLLPKENELLVLDPMARLGDSNPLVVGSNLSITSTGSMESGSTLKGSMDLRNSNNSYVFHPMQPRYASALGSIKESTGSMDGSFDSTRAPRFSHMHSNASTKNSTSSMHSSASTSSDEGFYYNNYHVRMPLSSSPPPSPHHPSFYPPSPRSPDINSNRDFGSTTGTYTPDGNISIRVSDSGSSIPTSSSNSNLNVVERNFKLTTSRNSSSGSTIINPSTPQKRVSPIILRE